MLPAFLVLLGFALFFGTHVGLATAPVRDRLVARLGERGFVHVFSLIATLAFAVWVTTTAAVRHEGLPGLGLTTSPIAVALAITAITLGFVLTGGSLAEYRNSPMALVARPVVEPHGVARVTRHGFFAGIALIGLGHVLVVPTLASATFFGGLALHAIVGAWHQDQKLLRKLGVPYRAYLAETSGLPFAAILSGRQHIAIAEHPWLGYGIGLLLAIGLRQMHDQIFVAGGLLIVISVAGGGGWAAWSAERAEKERVRDAR
ncbi:MAG: hypothetical protein GY723_01160 [bacterium]|nr:hypothetical protein [bacterium]MCP5069194.1 hypothetical protein [bacterium]